MRCRAALLLLPLLCCPALAPAQAPALATFRNLNGTFHVDLPASWRQIAPNEARAIGEHPAAPRRLGLAQPRHFYAVGPVDAWRAGDFTGPWLYVLEQDHEWYVEDDFAVKHRAMWAAETAVSGDHHELHDVVRAKVGVQQVEVVLAKRICRPSDGRPAVASLDVHAPAGKMQVTLSFGCPPERFAELEPEFRRWLATLTFAQVRRGQAGLADRLWTPLLLGGAVGLCLLLLYKHTRGRR